jgi:hypothetical protein
MEIVAKGGKELRPLFHSATPQFTWQKWWFNSRSFSTVLRRPASKTIVGQGGPMLNRELQQGLPFSLWVREKVSVHWCGYNYQQAQTNTRSSEVTIETSTIDRSMLHPGGGAPLKWL